jgi:hypothetical protein
MRVVLDEYNIAGIMFAVIIVGLLRLMKWGSK